jgi:hypothetical protein
VAKADWGNRPALQRAPIFTNDPGPDCHEPPLVVLFLCAGIDMTATGAPEPPILDTLPGTRCTAVCELLFYLHDLTGEYGQRPWRFKWSRLTRQQRRAIGDAEDCGLIRVNRKPRDMPGWVRVSRKR